MGLLAGIGEGIVGFFAGVGMTVCAYRVKGFRFFGSKAKPAS